MRSLSLLIILTFTIILTGCGAGSTTSSSSNPTWTWISGSNQINQSSTYGTKGIASSTNIPSGRFISTSWIDESGNFWLFGGAYVITPPIIAFNDLWKYNPNTNQWTWVSGNNESNIHGIYGTLGTPDDNNIPGARFGAVSWRDNENNLWLFGGYGYASTGVAGSLNDLWKYNITTNQWTWVNGNNSTDATGSYGSKGVLNSNNVPSARLGQIGWVDTNGNLWMFGGSTDLSTIHVLNDLWQYNLESAQWVWISGANISESAGNYGIQQESSPLNVPGARIDAISWLDSSGNLWLFGGDGIDGVGTRGLMNDLWKYNITSGLWTWMSGANTSNAYGVYGTIGNGTQNTIPGAREHRVPISWTDNTGNLWMFGGDGKGTSTSGILNDLWQYNPTNNIWTWVNGSNESNAYSSYGTMGVASTNNQPGARMDAIGWVDSSNTLWLFGGNGNAGDSNGLLNDLWRYR